MTVAEHDAELAESLRPVLSLYGLDGEDGLVRDLAGFMSRYAARQIEAHARSPVSQKGPGRKAATTKTRRRSA